MGLGRILDLVFFVYFLTHIPISVFVDLQSVLPPSWYPKASRDLLQWYTTRFKDAMMAQPPDWFKSFCVCEMLVQLPFFPVATYAFWKGNCHWIRIPAILYSTHVATTLIPIIAHVLFHDFSDYSVPGPSTLEERLTLTSIYAPYLVVPVLILLRMLFSSDYNSAPSKKKKVAVVSSRVLVPVCISAMSFINLLVLSKANLRLSKDLTYWYCQRQT